MIVFADDVACVDRSLLRLVLRLRLRLLLVSIDDQVSVSIIELMLVVGRMRRHEFSKRLVRYSLKIKLVAMIRILRKVPNQISPAITGESPSTPVRRPEVFLYR